MFGFLNIDKPQGCTSRDVVNQIQKLVRPAKIGHAGTLDPLATGVLVVCVGPATRLARFVQRMPKTYTANFRFGWESDTEDILGDVSENFDSPSIVRDDLEAVLPAFLGAISQRPPDYSALKVNGKRAYRLAREGKPVSLEPRPVFIHDLRLTQFEFPNFQLEIRCGSGTYVRSLGRDMALRLGTTAIMTSLQRTAIGNFERDCGMGTEELTLQAVADSLIVPQRGLTGLRAVHVTKHDAEQFLDGRFWRPENDVDDEEVAAIDPAGRLLAVLQRQGPRLFSPKINFSKYWRDQIESSSLD